jgi:hypothetical protein
LSAFHCARRLRVFARDILRFGTAIIRPYSWWGSPHKQPRQRQLPPIVIGDLLRRKIGS